MALTGIGFQINKKKDINSESKDSTQKEDKNSEKANSQIEIDKNNQNYNRIINIDVYEMEFNPHPSNVFRIWNITTGIWLKRYVRDRFIYYKNLNPGNTIKNISYIATFMISAFWHGFYPSYYIMFTHFPFMVILYQNYSKINRIYKVDQKFPKMIINVFY